MKNIVTVTLNAALDVTYHVDSVQPGHTHRVTQVRTRPGGKGVNVAAVLTQLGEPVIATGFAGPELGAQLPGFVPIAAESRRTVTVVSAQDGTATLFNEPGPEVSAAEWTQLLARFDRLAAEASVLVLSGSLPRGLPPRAYAELIGRCPVPVILDTDGEPLRHGIAARPALVKPNADELARLLGRQPDLPADCVALGVPVAATLGAHGAVLSTADGVWTARPPRELAGNPTGAGDAFTAALARGMAHGTPWPRMLADAVALSAAAVLSPVAGAYDPAAYRDFTDQVTVEES
ncbi:1-phosphofructokinase family hexose kinase [Kibdelosporangium persicum]|uniref:Tagatose 6-phosphate kinase n=1 Tax=Kibdelosporangium persicum TaxID=2698649 RepID=A0ABX2F2F0_9PSEU|nr:1-phosphofructokinase family hexose kinase [Kibdelosporangium persicum]NRN65407.1 Tagatose 6-phosphate kinase [Kibdelosporangium persicum]